MEIDMKKLQIVQVLAAMISASLLSVGCSSAKKEVSSTPSVSSASTAKVDSPVNLGAASAGRGR
jgi:hypothetical protein